MRGPGSSVGIATDYGLEGPGIEFRWRNGCESLLYMGPQSVSTANSCAVRSEGVGQYVRGVREQCTRERWNEVHSGVGGVIMSLVL